MIHYKQFKSFHSPMHLRVCRSVKRSKGLWPEKNLNSRYFWISNDLTPEGIRVFARNGSTVVLRTSTSASLDEKENVPVPRWKRFSPFIYFSLKLAPLWFSVPKKRNPFFVSFPFNFNPPICIPLKRYPIFISTYAFTTRKNGIRTLSEFAPWVVFLYFFFSFFFSPFLGFFMD